MGNNKKPRIIAFYLPQFHPIPENDVWWGKGFTEWTNVGKAKALFPGHYQPHVPADLGYYDLRMPEIREAQAKMAQDAGIEGFCYWHYWFGNEKELLEKPFEEVLVSGKPDYPFCLCWANHSWYSKTWNKDMPDKLLIEQSYQGVEDHEKHFNKLLPAFKDKRYMLVNNKPIFGIYSQQTLPNTKEFISLWNTLAKKNGLDGFYFITISYKHKNIVEILDKGYDGIVFDLPFLRCSFKSYFYLFLHKFFYLPQIIDYREYSAKLLKKMPVDETILPCVNPNFDHTPRSGRNGALMVKSTPENWKKLLIDLFRKINSKTGENNLVFIKSWNEWAEGNYLEPDLKYGKGYLTALRQAIEKS